MCMCGLFHVCVRGIYEVCVYVCRNTRHFAPYDVPCFVGVRVWFVLSVRVWLILSVRVWCIPGVHMWDILSVRVCLPQHKLRVHVWDMTRSFWGTSCGANCCVYVCRNTTAAVCPTWRPPERTSHVSDMNTSRPRFLLSGLQHAAACCTRICHESTSHVIYFKCVHAIYSKHVYKHEGARK